MMLPLTDHRVSSADFIRRFANWRAHSVRKPVVVTHHGRDAHVLLSHEDYRRLFEARDAKAKAVMDRSLTKLIDHLRDGIIIVDNDQRILSINRSACDMAECRAETAIGERFTTFFADVEQDHIFGHIVRMLKFKESYAGESVGFAGARYCFHVQLVPVCAGGAIILRDNSDEMTRFQRVQTRRAILRGVAACGGVGYAHLSPRGVIVSADPTLVDALGISEEAMRRVRFATLLPVAMRQAFGEAFEVALDGGEPVAMSSSLVGGNGDVIPVKLSVVELRGPFTCEGAMVVVSFSDRPT